MGRWAIACVLFLGIRFAALALSEQRFASDPDAYRALAESWAASGTFGLTDSEGHVHPTAFRPPVYPWLLSWLVFKGGLWLPGVGLLHGVLGTLTALLTMAIANRLAEWVRAKSDAEHGGGATSLDRSEGQGASLADSNGQGIRWVGLLAGLGTALDPILIQQSTVIMTETLATFLVTLGWWWWIRGSRTEPLLSLNAAMGLGLLGGLGALVRTSLIVWIPILFVFVLLFHYPFPWRDRFAWRLAPAFMAGTLLLGLFFAVFPWAVRNRFVMESSIWTTTHGGYTLLLGNNPVLYQHLKEEGFSRQWDEERFHKLWSYRHQADARQAEFWEYASGPANVLPTRVPELEDDRIASEAAWSTIRREPATFLKSCVGRWIWFWALWPAAGQVSSIIQVGIGIGYGILFFSVGLGLFHAIRSIFRPAGDDPSLSWYWFPAISLILGLIAVHTFYWSNMRMRAPVMPVLYVAATLEWLRIASRRRAT